MKKTVTILLVGLTFSFAFSETRAVMARFLAQLTLLKPYMVSESEFEKPANKKIITDHLRELARASKAAEHETALQSRNFVISRKVLEEQITEIQRSFRAGRLNYARWQLNSLTSVCMSCHSQMPAASRGFEEFARPADFGSPFERAEFLFATRAFDQSMGIYTKTINDYNGDLLTRDQVETAVKRELAYHVRVKRDLNAAAAALKSHLNAKNRHLWEDLRREMAVWITETETLRAEPAPDPASAPAAAVNAYAERILTQEPDVVSYLYVSGLLYEYLNRNGRGDAGVLYWLALCDRAVENNFFFSLADLYLKECITAFPESAYAPRCYDEYEQQTLASYSGSAGTHVPADVRAELARLKKSLRKKPSGSSAPKKK